LSEYLVKYHRAIGDIGEAAWQMILGDDNPFVSFAFLDALENSGTIRESYGWQVLHLTLYDADGLLCAACPGYLKRNSHGEFIFDWAWAQAYAQHGLDYYPKLLCAVPYSPVTGPRLLSRDRASKRALILALQQSCTELGFSSAHANFLDADDAQQFDAAGWLARRDIQFHWLNPPGAKRWRSFADFLGAMNAKKRKNISQERAKVAKLGLRIERLGGADLDLRMWDQIHALYEATFDAKGNTPALTKAFFLDFCARSPNQVMAVLAYEGQGDTMIAMALCFRSANTLYGRYWGAHCEIPGLHFECCYYQGIEYCLEHGLDRFEPGAQGEHKLARGFLPTETASAHYIVDARFRAGISRFVMEERQQRGVYRQELLAHSPFSTET
jgi:uncharacterized protein